MKKIIKLMLLLITMFISCCFINNTYAASASIKLKANKSTAIVGDTIKVTITLSSSTALGAWDFSVNYDSNYLTYVKSGSNLEGGDQAVNSATNDSTKSRTYTIVFKAKKAGTSKISIKSGADVVDWDNRSQMSVTTNSVTIKNITRSEYENSLSSDNKLKSLVVEGYELTPAFDKDVTSYSLTVPNDVRTLNVKATKNDSKAEVHGGGSVTLNEGINKIEVEVEAENGNSKTYVINVTVKELDPIEVTVDGKNYTVIRKRENMEAPSAYSETTTIIKGEEVPAYESDITGYTIVGLADSEGNVKLYIYKDDKYTLYNEYKFGGVTLYTFNPPDDEILKDTEKVDIKLGGKNVTAYRLENMEYLLVYGVNVETGEENWYTYDDKENTLQKFLGTNLSLLNNETEKFKELSIILGSVSGILFVFIFVFTIKLWAKKKTEVN